MGSHRRIGFGIQIPETWLQALLLFPTLPPERFGYCSMSFQSFLVHHLVFVWVRALASHQCGPGSNPGIDAICGLSLLLVLSLAPRGFSPGTPVFSSPQKPTFSNSNSIWNARTHLNDFIGTPKCFMGKKAKKKKRAKIAPERNTKNYPVIRKQ